LTSDSPVSALFPNTQIIREVSLWGVFFQKSTGIGPKSMRRSLLLKNLSGSFRGFYIYRVALHSFSERLDAASKSPTMLDVRLKFVAATWLFFLQKGI
jgi:hypothetical protein